MYRLTIYQASNERTYIVYDNDTLQGISDALKSYKQKYDTSKFINYDIIKFDEMLVESFELDNLDFSDKEDDINNLKRYNNENSEM